MKNLKPLTLVILIALAGCAGPGAMRPTADPAADQGAAVGSGPTLYGQLSVSADHVSVRR